MHNSTDTVQVSYIIKIKIENKTLYSNDLQRAFSIKLLISNKNSACLYLNYN